VLLNSAAAIHIARPDITMKDAVSLAAQTIDTGKAQAQLEEFVKLSRAAETTS